MLAAMDNGTGAHGPAIYRPVKKPADYFQARHVVFCEQADLAVRGQLTGIQAVAFPACYASADAIDGN